MRACQQTGQQRLAGGQAGGRVGRQAGMQQPTRAVARAWAPALGLEQSAEARPWAKAEAEAWAAAPPEAIAWAAACRGWEGRPGRRGQVQSCQPGASYWDTWGRWAAPGQHTPGQGAPRQPHSSSAHPRNHSRWQPPVRSLERSPGQLPERQPGRCLLAAHSRAWVGGRAGVEAL